MRAGVRFRNRESELRPIDAPPGAAAAAVAEYGSAWAAPMVRIAVVEQFCSWSAWRMNKMSSARASTGLAAYRGSAIFHIIDRKLAQKSSELSG